MDSFHVFWIDKMGYIGIVFLLIAGYLIVSGKKSLRLLALYLYLFHNILALTRGFMGGVSSFITSGFIFGILTIVNIIRVSKSK